MNENAPFAHLKNSAGSPVSLDDLKGQFVVLYFYPKDFTPGCTTEACAFRDANDDLRTMGVKVIGVSKDSPESHRRFLEKHQLNFELWSDPEAELMNIFGVIGEKTIFGKTLIGVKRMTVILDPMGKVIKIYKTVKPAEHAQQVLTFLRSVV